MWYKKYKTKTAQTKAIVGVVKKTKNFLYDNYNAKDFFLLKETQKDINDRVNYFGKH